MSEESYVLNIKLFLGFCWKMLEKHDSISVYKLSASETWFAKWKRSIWAPVKWFLKINDMINCFSIWYILSIRTNSNILPQNEWFLNPIYLTKLSLNLLQFYQFNSRRRFSCFSKKLVLKVKICRKSKLKRSSRPFFRGMTGQDRTNGCETTDFLHQNHETSSSINHNRTLSFFNFIRVLLDDLFFTFSCIIWGNK